MSLTIAQSQALALARIEAIVRGATPLRMTDRPFTCVEDADGRMVPLEKMPSGFRYFQVRHAAFMVRDPSRVTCRVVQALVLRIRYDADSLDTVDLERLIAEDLVVIDSALRVPSAWQMGTTGIKALMLDDGTAIGRTSGVSPESPAWHIIGVPYTLTLEASC